MAQALRVANACIPCRVGQHPEPPAAELAALVGPYTQNHRAIGTDSPQELRTLRSGAPRLTKCCEIVGLLVFLMLAPGLLDGVARLRPPEVPKFYRRRIATALTWHNPEGQSACRRRNAWNRKRWDRSSRGMGRGPGPEAGEPPAEKRVSLVSRPLI